jgi:hypothetical protein
MKGIYMILSVFILLTACTMDDGINKPNEIAEFLNSETSAIKQTVVFEKAKLVFYIPNNHNFSIGLGWIKKDKRKWKWVSGGALSQSYEQQDLTYSWYNLDQMNKQGKGAHIFWGMINNNDITKVHVSYRNEWDLDAYAEIIDVGDKRIWYVLADYYYGTIPGINIIGYGSTGEKIYEHY